jgi:Protoglobin
MPVGVTGPSNHESFIDEMKRYVGFSDSDAELLKLLGPRMARHLPAMAERFYSQIPHHPAASRVFTGGQEQIDRLKRTLQGWGAALFKGVYDESYAEDRYRIGFRHVRIGLDQKYVISAMGVIRSFLLDRLGEEFPDRHENDAYSRALGKLLDVDLVLICDSYARATEIQSWVKNEVAATLVRLQGTDDFSSFSCEFPLPIIGIHSPPVWWILYRGRHAIASNPFRHLRPSGIHRTDRVRPGGRTCGASRRRAPHSRPVAYQR